MLRWLVKKIGGFDVIDLYVALIIAGRRTINQVPTRCRETVKEEGKPLE